MSSKFLAELSNDYEKLFKTELGYDVVILAGEEPNVKEIHAHSNILCIRSQYFNSAFSNEWTEKKDGKFILRKPKITPTYLTLFLGKIYKIFKKNFKKISNYFFIIRFIYCGDIELKNL